MKKLSYIIMTLFLILGLSLSAFLFHERYIQDRIHKVIRQEKRVLKEEGAYQSLEIIKQGNVDFYYYAPLKNNADFYQGNLPLSLYKEKRSDSEFVLIIPKFTKSTLKNVKRASIHQVTYRKGFLKVTKKSDKVISSYHVTNDYQQFRVTDLVNGHIDRIAEEINKLDPETVFDPTLTGNLTEKNGVLSDSLKIDDNGIVVQDKKEIPFQNLFDVINPSFLSGKTNRAYEAYQEKKKEEAAAKVAHEKMVALTFDDGPNPETTPRVLELLAKYGAKATFFMLGSKVVANQELVKKVHDNGNEIGNHSWDHPNLTKLAPEQIQNQVQSTNDAIAKACGQKPLYLRPPYGATNEVVKKAAAMNQMLWTVDTRDWDNHNTQAMMANIKNQLQPGGVILMHDIHKTTVDALPTILEYLKKEGYKCVTVSQLMGHS
ncbi:deacetylase [Streptococcus bovimastitidis]|uniref:Deacetylase n=1 Tax=Streptococcus bovimastitidis TaxID=1856638 RepID=A0A1L8MN11_9STRE|nr:polysaccharide deacetylase family protein [Streptococcus bovimastitidis]OJF72131.1 deacetylase [Streptococcus bovimastitidis]